MVFHHWLFGVVLGGCAFNPPELGGGDDTPGGTDGATPKQPHVCTVPDTKLCIEFEQDDNPMALALDSSGNSHDAVGTLVVGDVERRIQKPALTVNEKAVAMTQSSRLEIGDTRDLAITGDFTIELWFIPSVTAGSRFWLLDSSGRYFMSYGDDHQIRCGINDGSDKSKTVDSNQTIEPDLLTWHHVACVFDSVDHDEMRVYLDGQLSDCSKFDQVIEPRICGTSIGVRHLSGDPFEHFVGALDNVHVYATKLAPAAICTLATGGTTCGATCPGGAEGGGSSGDS